MIVNSPNDLLYQFFIDRKRQIFFVEEVEENIITVIPSYVLNPQKQRIYHPYRGQRMRRNFDELLSCGVFVLNIFSIPLKRN